VTDQPDPVQDALVAGAKQSREACSPRERAPLHLAIWKRLKWPLVGLGLFALFELVMFAAGSTIGGKF